MISLLFLYRKEIKWTNSLKILFFNLSDCLCQLSYCFELPGIKWRAVHVVASLKKEFCSPIKIYVHNFTMILAVAISTDHCMHDL